MDKERIRLKAIENGYKEKVYIYSYLKPDFPYEKVTKVIFL